MTDTPPSDLPTVETIPGTEKKIRPWYQVHWADGDVLRVRPGYEVTVDSGTYRLDDDGVWQPL